MIDMNWGGMLAGIGTVVIVVSLIGMTIVAGAMVGAFVGGVVGAILVPCYVFEAIMSARGGSGSNNNT